MSYEYPKPVASAEDLPKSYEGLARERFWQQYWREARTYEFSLNESMPDGSLRPRERDEIYSIDTPPPTVSGALHIGHVYSYTQTDMSARYQRMRGKHVYYPFGFDDNGLPTERLVERIEGIKAHEFIAAHAPRGREAFIELCQKVVVPAEQEFIALWQSLALSCDWKEFYTTIDERSRAISQASFVDLFRKGIAYRKDAPTQWCWADQTAIAQAEIEDREVAGFFHDIQFGWADGPGQPVGGTLTIATTRPELIPACVAVLAHPEDERYKHLFGKVAVTPLFEVEVPILPSEKADPEKGTGILMCCTFGDMDDVEHWEKFKLPTRVIIGKDGKISERLQDMGSSDWPARNPEAARALGNEMQGLKVKAAQEWMRGKLKEAGLLLAQKDIMHTVRHSERGGVPIEILVTPQWYVNILGHKEALLEQGRRINWHPEYMRKRYEQWVEGLNGDWCISRQRYNGVPFPVWYHKGTVILPEVARLPVNPLTDVPTREELIAAGLDGNEIATPDPDVMDTWATSSVTPLLNTLLRLGAETPEAKDRHSRLFPFDLRPQAHDIIRTWAFYTIAKAWFHFEQIPWRDIAISGHAQDAGGKKISKSKGHVVTPAEMVDKYTADGLRYWSSGCKLGTDTLYDETKLGEGRKLINKLFNATKFALRHLIDFDPRSIDAGLDQSSLAGAGGTATANTYEHLASLITYPTDIWLIGRLNATIEKATRANNEYEFADAKQAAEDFFWADFCDNYLELSKGRLYGEALAVDAHGEWNKDSWYSPVDLRLSAQATLFIALSSVLRLFAPALPHITEECWSWYFGQFGEQWSIHLQPWPEPLPLPQLGLPEMGAEDSSLLTPLSQLPAELLLTTLGLTRKLKSEAGVSIKKPIKRLSIYRTEHAPRDSEGNLLLVEGHLHEVLGDLLSTTNSQQALLLEGSAPADSISAERSPIALLAEFAEDSSS
ncbi:valine--tRNA ligase [bacterium]|nr:valine--tRNA ligase [bacterium]